MPVIIAASLDQALKPPLQLRQEAGCEVRLQHGSHHAFQQARSLRMLKSVDLQLLLHPGVSNLQTLRSCQIYIFPFSFIHPSIPSSSVIYCGFTMHRSVCRGLCRPHLIQPSRLSCRYCHLCFQEQKLEVRGLAASPRWWSWGTNSDLPNIKASNEWASETSERIIYSLRKESWAPPYLAMHLLSCPPSLFLFRAPSPLQILGSTLGRSGGLFER